MKINEEALRTMAVWHKDHIKHQEAFVALLDFKSKDDYLEWVANWKALYKGMTEEVRNCRRAWKENRVEIYPHYWHSERRVMMELRAAGKVKSWAMRNARLAEENLLREA